MNKKKLLITTLLTLLLSGVNSVFSQEWEAVYYSDEFASGCDYNEAIELSNGNVLAASLNYPVNLVGMMFSTQPTLSLISSEGEELYRNMYVKPGLCETTCPYLFEKNGEMYFLTSYSPDHDVNSDNYFKNFDNPPTDAVLGLYKLDDCLNIAKSYEHIYPIDTFERRDELWYDFLNYYCGYLYVYSAFEDDGNITGSYISLESVSSNSSEHDSIYFFKMDFEGNFLVRKGYELPPRHGMSMFVCNRQQMVKTDDGYIVYYRGVSLDYHGTVEYYDNDFNHITTKYVLMPGSSGWFDDMLYQHCIMRSNHNTTYVSTMHYKYNPAGGKQVADIRLYEFDDDVNNSGELIPVLNYIERGAADHDRTALRSMDMTKEGDIYFTYSLNCGFEGDNYDSWIMIERLDSDFDTLATYFYNEAGVYNRSSCLTATKDDGLLLVSLSYNVNNIYNRWSKVSKFPASAFGIDNIEEAHAHGLHLAVAYPNPGGDVMNIRTGLRNAVLTVYDLQGRKIHEQEITDDVTSVDASKWQSGTYIWKLVIRNEELGLKEVESGKWVK